MITCSKCGAQMDDTAKVCSQCGERLECLADRDPVNPAGDNTYVQPPVNTSNDAGGFGWGLLGFCIPIVGLILFIIWKDEKPKSSKAAGIGALVSVIIGVVLCVLIPILTGILAAMAGTM